MQTSASSIVDFEIEDDVFLSLSAELLRERVGAITEENVRRKLLSPYSHWFN